jgi:pectate lyase
LRSCAQSNGAKWIVFDVSGTINLSSNLNIQSNKTIDGRGADITLTNSGPWIDNGVENIVIHNIKVVGTWDDNIHLNNNVKKIWIDHVYMATPGDESIGISTSNSTSQSPRDITVSWCKFDKSGFGALVGGSPSYTNNVDITLTMHHNFYNAVRERAPRMSYGKAHLYNNYIYNWAWTGAVSTQTAQVASENNIYEDGSNTMDHRGLLADADGGTAAGYIRSSGDLFLGTATSKIAGSDKVFDPHSYYSYSIDTADSSLKTRVMNGAGWQNVPKPL